MESLIIARFGTPFFTFAKSINISEKKPNPPVTQVWPEHHYCITACFNVGGQAADLKQLA